MKKKIDLEAEAENSVSDAAVITAEDLLEVCPKEILPEFKKAKTDGARVDLLYKIVNNELKEAKRKADAIDTFCAKLKQFFLQNLDGDQTGITGKVGRVEVKTSDVASVEDWDKFYAYIAKKKEFDLLNKAVNQKAVKARWEEEKEVPGIGKFVKKTISLTKV